MSGTIIPDYPRGITFEEVWAMFQETDKKFQKNAEEMVKIQESQKETEKFLKNIGKQVGDLTNTFGDLTEHLVAPNIAARFNEIGFHFDGIAPGGFKILDEHGKIKAQIDLILENGDNIVAIEVKSRPREKDIEHHIQRLEILREYREKKNDKRKTIQGGIAGAIFGEVEKKATLEARFYVLEQSGNTMKLITSDDFVPREW